MESPDEKFEHLKQYTILIAEDDEIALRSLCNTLKRYFKNVITATNGYDASDCVLSQKIDIILTDMRMPYQDGADFIKQIRDLDFNIPVIFMSAYSDSQTLLKVIPLNVTDYLIKPIEIEKVLYLCLKNLQKKVTLPIKQRVEKYVHNLTNGIRVDLIHKMVSKNDEIVFLTKKEFELLTLFLKNKHSILSKTQIEYALWNEDTISESSVKTLIKKLRSKIGEESIITVKNLGYKIQIS